MSHLLTYKEWQGASGNWYCNDIKELGTAASKWWAPARLLDKTVSEYAEWLLENYKPDKYSWDGKTFVFSWTKEHYTLCHRFVLDINRISRNKNFIC